MAITVELASPLRAVVKASLYLVFVCVVSFVGIEVALRALSLTPTIGGFTVTETEFRRIPGLFSPNQSFVEATPSGLDHRVTIDSLGYRGNDFPRVKPPGEMRIVLAGDSFTWGSHVDAEETLPAALENAMAAACGPNVRTVNAGVPGTTIVSQAHMLRRATPLEPDLAIVVFHDNDFVNLANGAMWYHLAENRIKKSKPPLSIVYPIVRETALWNLSLEVWRRQLTQDWLQDPAQDSTDATEVWTPTPEQDSIGLALYAEHLAALGETMEAAEIPLLLVAYPATSRPLESPDSPRLGTKAIQAAEALGIPAFDLYPTFWNSRLPPEVLSLIPRDGHPSPSAHALAGQAIADVLLSTPELGTTCSGREAQAG